MMYRVQSEELRRKLKRQVAELAEDCDKNFHQRFLLPKRQNAQAKEKEMLEMRRHTFVGVDRMEQIGIKPGEGSDEDE